MTAGAAVILANRQVNADDPPGLEPVPALPAPIEHIPGVYTDEARELARFAQTLIEYRRQRSLEHAPSKNIPFATLPLNVYMRTPEEMAQDLGPVKLTETLAVILDQPEAECQRRLQNMIRCLWATLMVPVAGACAKEWRGVNRIKKRFSRQPQMTSSRIITPRYTCDMDELSEVSLGICLVDGVVSMLQEMAGKVTVATRVFRENTPDKTPKQLMCFSWPQISIRREGFMFEFFTWVNMMGVIVPSDDTATIDAYAAFQGD